jgi:hypothetical protein
VASAATPPESVFYKLLYPEGIAALRMIENVSAAGIPPGYNRLGMLETGGVAALTTGYWL